MQDRASKAGGDELFVSVIVPVFNDAERLRICLEALAGQTYDAASYEVIVVDNGSDESENIAGVVSNFPLAVYAYEPRPGSYAARNKGLALAKGPVLAFTDADCIPSPTWIETGTQYLERTPNCGLVAGRIELFFKREKGNAIELYENLTAFSQQRWLTEAHGAATANVFTFKSVVEKVGPFNESLFSSGDFEWSERVFLAGYRQVYAQDACVAHPARHTLKQLYKRTVRIAGGVFDRCIRAEQSVWRRNWLFGKLLLAELTPPVNFAISNFRDSRLQGAAQKLSVSLVLLWVRYVSAFEMVRLRLGGVPHRG
ncbi:MAG: glycosyltransferase family 2 protein [Cyanobacteria bacterium J06614_10]